MKSFLYAGLAGLCLAFPSLSVASTVNFETSGSQCTLLFDPQGCDPSQLPPSGFYRSYDCRIGRKYQPVVIFTKPIVPVIPPPHYDPPKGNPPINNPVVPPINPPSNPCSVPLPASSEMAGAGLVAAALLSQIRSRRPARA